MSGSAGNAGAPADGLRGASLAALASVQATVVVSLVPWFVITVFLMPRPFREGAWLIARLFLSNLWAYPLFLLVLSAAMWTLFAIRQYKGAIAASLAAFFPTGFFLVLFLLPERWFR